MRTRKKAAAIVLAIGMAVTGSLPAMAAAVNKDLVEGDFGGVTDGNADSVLSGTIKITNISVKVPIKASFDIDPNGMVEAATEIGTGNNTNQITAQASNYTITNTSKVPLKVSITGVTTKGQNGTGATIPTLVNKMDDLTGTNVMFAIRKTGDKISYPAQAAADTTNTWMMSTIAASAPYFVTGTEATVLKATGVSDQSDTLNMTLYGATGNGWKDGEGFQIIPTFTVELAS